MKLRNQNIFIKSSGYFTFIILMINANILFSQASLSHTARQFVADISQYIDVKSGKVVQIPEKILADFDLYQKNGNYYLGVLILTDENFNKNELIQRDMIISSELENILALRIPVQSMNDLVYLKGVLYIEAGSGISPDLDLSVATTRADSVHLGLGGLPKAYKGNGVIVAVIDWGFDYTHPVFYDSSLTKMRLSRAWDQNKLSGPAPKGFDFGTEYVGESQLLAAKEDTLYVFGPMTHGTHVAGIAGGNGAGTKYTGIAPESELVFISLKRDAPSLIDAFNYVSKYAESVNKPFVINMSFGSHLGPHDGSSLQNMAIDILAGKGRVFVGSAGNNGDNFFHIKRDFTLNPDTLKTVVSFVSGLDEYYGQTLAMWGSPFSSFSVAFRLVDNANQTIFETPFYSSVTEPFLTDSFFLNLSDTLLLRIQSSRQFLLNNKPNINIEVRNRTPYKVVLLIASEDSEVHIWNTVRLDRRYTNWGVTLGSNYPGAEKGNSAYGLGEPGGVGKQVITVASYLSEIFLPGGQMQRGLLSTFSSNGPTVDERTKPDISGPGQNVVSSVSSFDPTTFSVVETVAFNGKDYRFVSFSGTSMSGPAVAGIVALLLEKKPDLTAEQVKNILKGTARLDIRTGQIGEEGTNNWGWGKANALAALLAIDAFVSEKQVLFNPPEIMVYPNPASEEINIENINTGRVNLYDMQGKLIKTFKNESNSNPFRIECKGFETGVYLLEIIGTQSVTFSKIIIKN